MKKLTLSVTLLAAMFFSLYLQPVYQQKGALVADLDDNIEFPFTLAFLELPVFVKAEFGSTVRPYLMADPTVGYLLSADVEGQIEGITFKGDLKDVTASIDFGLGFGAGVSYPIAQLRFFWKAATPSVYRICKKAVLSSLLRDPCPKQLPGTRKKMLTKTGVSR